MLAVAAILIWMWESDPKPLPRAEIGHGIKVPTYVSGPLSHSWWAMVVLLLVAGSLYLAYVFSYLYLWTVSPQVWPKPAQLPALSWPAISALLLAASSGLILLAGRTLSANSEKQACVLRAHRIGDCGARRRFGYRGRSRNGASASAPMPMRMPRWSTWRRSCSLS